MSIGSLIPTIRRLKFTLSWEADLSWLENSEKKEKVSSQYFTELNFTADKVFE